MCVAQGKNLRGLERISSMLKFNTDAILESCSSAQKADVVNKLLLYSRQRQWMWSYALRKLLHSDCCRIVSRETCDDQLRFSLGVENSDSAAQFLLSELALVGDDWRDSAQLLASVRRSLPTNANAKTLERVVSAVELLRSWQSKHSEEFLFSADLQKHEGNKSAWTVVEVIHFLSSVVKSYPQCLSDPFWDFILWYVLHVRTNVLFNH